MIYYVQVDLTLVGKPDIDNFGSEDIVRETEKSFQVKCGNELVWIPKCYVSEIDYKHKPKTKYDRLFDEMYLEQLSIWKE